MRFELGRNQARKVAGPDGIISRLLKSCTDQLSGMVKYFFNLSLELGRIPQLWKVSCMVPVPKTPHPKDLRSYRPVALTSHLMKTPGRLVLVHLCPLVSLLIDSQLDNKLDWTKKTQIPSSRNTRVVSTC